MFGDTFEEAWTRRYGTEPISVGVNSFLTHRSVRRYADRDVPEEVIEAIIAAGQSASTSSSLQLWSLISVRDQDRREQIALAAANQSQIRSAPWFFAVLADLHRVESLANRGGVDPSGLDSTEMLTMAIVDASLATERMVCAAEELGLGACYIGALRDHPAQIANILELPPRTFGLFGLCIGYPRDTDAEIKPRLSIPSVWHRERYSEVEIGDYDARMADFFESQQMASHQTWSEKSAHRVKDESIGIRLGLREWLHRQGLGTR